jgi:ADP-ribosylglycohydrolase
VIASLEASLYAFLKTNTYAEAVLTAVNLGDDTDTVGAITGGLAGTFYGYTAIPAEWLTDILKKERIIQLVEQFYEKYKTGRLPERED